MKQIGLVVITLVMISSADSYYERGVLRELTPVSSSAASASAPTMLKSMSRTGSSEPKWYRTEDGKTVGVVNSIVVQWKEGADVTAALEELHLTDAKPLTESIWEITVPAGKDVFELSRELYEHESTVIAHPNMIRERGVR